MFMKKVFYKLLITFIFISLLFIPNVFATNAPDFSLNSTAAYLLDASSRANVV